MHTLRIALLCFIVMLFNVYPFRHHLVIPLESWTSCTLILLGLIRIWTRHDFTSSLVDFGSPVP